MFYNHQTFKHKSEYHHSLKLIGSLSNLFSDSDIPYLYYRVAEKLFCNSFRADDLSRGDVALDAVKNEVGIGLKTFLAGNNKTLQKIAEFNKDKPSYEGRNSTEIVKIISQLRNKRVDFVENLYNIENSLYHCVIRTPNSFKIHEEKMDKIAVENIIGIKQKKNTIIFNDTTHEYSFNLSKSTLYKRFIIDNPLHEFDVNILTNPLKILNECIEKPQFEFQDLQSFQPMIILPLYGKNYKVFERSGLNQWNAAGRDRDINEIYIPIPIQVHKMMPNFFPTRDKSFNLILPNNVTLKSKVCQDNSKALMSYSNKELGKWLLRDVLSLKEGELLTYSKLQLIGIDSIRIDKIDENNYKVNFSAIGNYERFINS